MEHSFNVKISVPDTLAYAEEDGGWNFYPFLGGMPPERLPENLHLVSVAPGRSRGDHLHPGHREHLFIFGGEGSFRWEEKGRVLVARTRESGLLVEISPGVAHVLINDGDREIYVLALRVAEEWIVGEETVDAPLSGIPAEPWEGPDNASD